MMSITVGIPHYNYLRYLDMCVDSVIAEADEVIIVDDATEGFPEWLDSRTYKPAHLHVVRHDRNTGSAMAAWGELVAMCRTDWLMYLSADDAMLPGFRSRIERCEADWIWGDLVIMDEEGRNTGAWDYSPFPTDAASCLQFIAERRMTYPTFAGAAFRVKWLRDNALGAMEWEGGLKGYEDILMAWTYLKASPRLEYTRTPWIRYRRHSGSETFTADRGAAMARFDSIVKGET